MIIEITFALVGGVNLGLDRSYQLIEDIIKRYPKATWKRLVNRKKMNGKYIITIDDA